MRQATLLVIKKDYKGDNAIDNVIGYALDSYFADLDEVMLHNIRSDSYDHIVEDFYNAQSSLDMTNRRRLFHFILTTPVSKDMQRTLYEGAEELLEYFESLGHQVIMVPHDSSKTNCLNYHWHIIVNSVSYITGQMLYDRYETYNAIINYLNQNPHTTWSWRYKNSGYHD